MKIIVLCPLFNDDQSFNIHTAQLEPEIKKIRAEFTFVAVNDGSYKRPQITSPLPVTIIHLHRNVGHQKAISVGLAYVYHHLPFDKLVIMDCDGEDRAADITALINASANNDSVIFAHRSSRQEGKGFKFFYFFYKLLFRVLTGRTISFGNFMLIPRSLVEKIIYYSEIWSHVAGGILKSGTPFKTISTHRGKRYAGSSKMNFTSLLLHGLGAIGVFIEVVATRLLVFSFIMIVVSVLAIFVTIGIKVFTRLAIPGWATTASTSMIIILLQSFLLSLFTIFLYISTQAQRKLIPALHYSDQIHSVENIA